jgi:hypothetical protein
LYDLPFCDSTNFCEATLWAVSEGNDTDWNVMLLHVYPDGRAERIQDGVMRARFRAGLATDDETAWKAVAKNYDVTNKITNLENGLGNHGPGFNSHLAIGPPAPLPTTNLLTGSF